MKPIRCASKLSSLQTASLVRRTLVSPIPRKMEEKKREEKRKKERKKKKIGTAEMPNGAKHHLRGLTISSVEISLIFETRCLPVAIRGTFVRHSALRFLMGRCRQLWWIISWKIFSRLEEMEYLRLFFFFLSFLYIPCDLIDWLIDQLKMSPRREFCRSDLRERERERDLPRERFESETRLKNTEREGQIILIPPRRKYISGIIGSFANLREDIQIDHSGWIFSSNGTWKPRNDVVW